MALAEVGIDRRYDTTPDPSAGRTEPTADDDRGLAAAHDRLRVSFPDTSPAVVAELLFEAYARTAGARVQTYRVLLAERSARSALRTRRTTLGPAKA